MQRNILPGICRGIMAAHVLVVSTIIVAGVNNWHAVKGIMSLALQGLFIATPIVSLVAIAWGWKYEDSRSLNWGVAALLLTFVPYLFLLFVGWSAGLE